MYFCDKTCNFMLNWSVVQITMNDSPDVKFKIIDYAYDLWNFLEILTFVTYITGLILRFIPVAVCSTCFYVSRIIFAFNHMMFFFCILRMFAVHEVLGPKLVMISKMVRFWLCYWRFLMWVTGVQFRLFQRNILHVHLEALCISVFLCFTFNQSTNQSINQSIMGPFTQKVTSS